MEGNHGRSGVAIGGVESIFNSRGNYIVTLWAAKRSDRIGGVANEGEGSPGKGIG